MENLSTKIDMGKKLAIKGHLTRGKEVIEILKMLGGNDDGSWWGNDMGSAYFINDCTEKIDVCKVETDIVVFTLEEFLEKYPYKVDDKVEVYETGKVFTIGNMMWEDELCTVHYANMEDFEYYTAKELKLYKETNMNENKCTQCVYAVNNNHCGLRGFRSNFNVNYCSAQNVDKLPNGFELQEDGYFSWVNKKPKYPTTYEECWKVRFEVDGETILDEFHHVSGYYSESLGALQKLLCCRDAYWKIAGEEMGLGKPWEPVYVALEDNTYFIIQTFNGEIDKSATSHRNAILAFPNIEMRDAFYENFKDLIESCKELL